MTRQIKIATLTVGGRAPVRVESMLKERLSGEREDMEKCRAQCERLLAEGCELARLAFPSPDLEKPLEWLLQHTRLPIMADIHFDPDLALAAMRAGCASIRINPGNMPLHKLTTLIDTAKDKGVVIRIGANGGSLSGRHREQSKGDSGVALFLAVKEQADLLLQRGFCDIILSAKSSSVPDTIRANGLLASAYPDLPTHIGITEAGPGDGGIVKGVSGIAALLSQGIGNTLRVSLTDEPEREVRVGYAILRALELRQRGPNLISCPTCGRRRADVRELVKLVEPLISGLPDGTTVAVMGCEVNGPKEAANAQYGIAGTPVGAVLFKNGTMVGNYSFDSLPSALPEFFSSRGDIGG